MNDAEFQLKLEDLINDYDVHVARDESITESVKKIRDLCNEYLKSRFKESLNPKSSLNGADC